jgi:hypothetical protein
VCIATVNIQGANRAGAIGSDNDLAYSFRVVLVKAVDPLSHFLIILIKDSTLRHTHATTYVNLATLLQPQRKSITQELGIIINLVNGDDAWCDNERGSVGWEDLAGVYVEKIRIERS